MEHITKEQFEEYERIREEGQVNMFNIQHVVEMSGESLSKEDIELIQEHYEDLCFKYASI